MIGPVVLVVGGLAVGLASGGGWGALVGVSLGLFVVAGVVVLAATWARQIGAQVDPDDAWRLAPRPPGFGELCDWVYRRTLPDGD